MGVHAQMVLDVFDEHPDWTSSQIADVLDCHPAYVRVALRRNGRVLSRTRPGCPRPVVRTIVRAGLIDKSPTNAIRFQNGNDRAVCQFVTGLTLEPFALGGGFWQRQRQSEDGSFVYSLVMPSLNGEVDLYEGDWAVQIDGCWLRLTHQQMTDKHHEWVTQ